MSYAATAPDVADMQQDRNVKYPSRRFL